MNTGAVLTTSSYRTEQNRTEQNRTEQEGQKGGYEQLYGVVEHGTGESAGILKIAGLRNTF